MSKGQSQSRSRSRSNSSHNLAMVKAIQDRANAKAQPKRGKYPQEPNPRTFKEE